MFQSFMVTLREGLAAAIVAGIALTYSAKTGRIAPGKKSPRKKRCAQPGLRHAGKADGAAPDGGGKRVELEMLKPPVALTDLEPGEAGTIDHISLPLADQQFLMRIGFVPGVQVRFSRRAPLGDPSVYSVDGTEIALRAETARAIMVRPAGLPPLGELP